MINDTLDDPENGIGGDTPRPKKLSDYRPEHVRVTSSDLHFHCDWFHHIVQLPNTYCAIVYQLAAKLSNKSGVFDASAINIARDLGCEEKTIRRANELLRNTDWFAPIKRARSHGVYRPNPYGVRQHAKWAELHPGLCGERFADSLPWAGEGDKIAQYLSQHTGGAVKWREFETAKLRSFGLEDAALQELFSVFWDQYGFKLKPRNVAFRFNEFLKERAKSGFGHTAATAVHEREGAATPPAPVHQGRSAAGKSSTPPTHADGGPQKPVNQAVNVPDALMRELADATRGKLDFTLVNLAKFSRYRDEYGDDLVKEGFKDWLRSNDIQGRTRKQATLDFITDLPAHVHVVKMRMENRALAERLKTPSAGGLSSPTNLDSGVQT